MKLSIISFLLAFVACAYAAAISYEQDMEGLAKRVDGGELVASTLPDGRRKIEIYDEGVYEGYLLETEDGVQVFDAEGAELSLDDFEEDGTLVARGKWSIIVKFGKILGRWGKRAWDYIYCVGFNSMLDCGDEFLGCAEMGTPPWSCISGGICIGSKHKSCK